MFKKLIKKLFRSMLQEIIDSIFEDLLNQKVMDMLKKKTEEFVDERMVKEKRNLRDFSRKLKKKMEEVGK